MSAKTKRNRRPRQSNITLVSASLPPTLAQKIRDDAKAQERTVSNVVGRILAEHYGLPLSKWKE